MTATEPRCGDALVIIDVQNDFLPGGCLGVRDGHEAVEVINRYIATFRDHQLPIVATRDWHPQNHCSFEIRGGMWPRHCVADSPGAAFPSALTIPCETVIVSKATTPEQEAYSAFESTELCARLRDFGVHRLFVCGLATEYCVLATVHDALRLGFQVLVLEDGIRAVDLAAGDGERALQEMLRLGAKISSLETIEV